MKIRQGFVSNSSSSSFIIDTKNEGDKVSYVTSVLENLFSGSGKTFGKRKVHDISEEYAERHCCYIGQLDRKELDALYEQDLTYRELIDYETELEEKKAQKYVGCVHVEGYELDQELEDCVDKAEELGYFTLVEYRFLG